MQVQFQEGEPTVYTYDKEDNTWYNQRELNDIRTSISTTLKARNRGGDHDIHFDSQANTSNNSNNNNEEEYCIRGLESFTLESSPSSSFTVGSKFQGRRFVSNLLEVQNEHRDMGMEDPIGLSRFSFSQSKECRKRALRLAADDATIALRIHNDDTRKLDWSSKRSLGQIVNKVQSAMAA